MLTVMKHQTSPLASPPTLQPGVNKQLRRDRWTALTVVTVVIAMMALLVWLASLGGGVPNEGIEYWHMMP